MLKKAVVCMLLAAAAAMAWLPLQDVQAPAQVNTGAKLTWGNGLVWGLFPTRDSGETYVEYYQPDLGRWNPNMEEIGEYLIHTGLTFQWQWMERPVLFVIGEDTSGGQGNEVSTLYWYDLYTDQWDYEEIDPDTGFVLDNGTCIAFAPNPGWDVDSFPVPGWIYCLPGGDTSFWRYSIAAESSDISQYGYYPCPNAIIADQTPPFQWSPYAQPTQYRIQVSTDQYFMSCVIDTVVSIPAFEPTTKLANSTYYWRAAAWVSGAWSWCSPHNFDLQGGWEQRKGITGSVGTGAAMAYDGDVLGYEAILALRGGGHKDFYAYNIITNQWDTLEDAPVNVHVGTSLSTHDPTGEWAAHPVAAFGGSDTSDCPYHYHPDGDPDYWVPFDTTDTSLDWCSHFPEDLGSDASMIQGASHMCYLVVGEENFYRLEPPPESKDGGLAGVVRSGKVDAHSVSCLDGIEVEYQLPAAARVRAVLHDAVGRRVGMLAAGEQKAGVHRLSWNRDQEGRKLSAGAYFMLLDMGKEQVRLKAVVR